MKPAADVLDGVWMSDRIRKAAVFLASIEIWPVSLAVGLSILSARLLPAAVIVAAAFWVVRWVACGSLSVRTLADWPIVVLVLLIPVTLWATPLPSVTVPQVYRLATGILLFYALVNWTNTSSRLRLVFSSTALIGIGLALSAPVTVQWATDKLSFIPDSVYQRFTLLVSDTTNPNVLAGYLAILLPCALALLLFCWTRLNWLFRLFVVGSVLCMGAVMALTQSRGALLALTAALIVMVMLCWKWGWLLVFPSVFVAGILIRLLGIARLVEILASSSTLGSAEGRVEVWSRAIYMIRDFPFTGIGIGMFGSLADAVYPFFHFAPQTVPHAHNLFLQIAVDLGIPGLIAWLAVLFIVFFVTWQLYREGRAQQDPWISGMGAGLFCSQLAMTLHGMTDAVTWGMVRPAPIIWALWGLSISAWAVRVRM